MTTLEKEIKACMDSGIDLRITSIKIPHGPRETLYRVSLSQFHIDNYAHSARDFYQFDSIEHEINTARRELKSYILKLKK